MSGRYSYFPGCTLSTTARAYDASGRAVASALGLELAELKDWNCCGAAFPLSTENVLDMIGPARTLIAAERDGSDLATLCAVCFNVLKRTDHFLRTHSDAADRLNQFVDTGAYSGRARVRHLLGILRDDVGWPTVTARVQAPLSGQRLAAYYGCMLLRPRGEMQLDDPEAPRVMDDLLAALGAEPVGFSHSTECCGSYLLVSQPPAAGRLSERIVEAAASAGAGAIVTACPLCAFNLERAQVTRPQASRLPVVYFTQVMAAAFGLPEHAGPLAVAA